MDICLTLDSALNSNVDSVMVSKSTTESCHVGTDHITDNYPAFKRIKLA